MIDVDKLERKVDAIDGDLVAMSKGQLADIFADLRAGMRARVELARQAAFGTLCDKIAAGQSS